MVQSLLQALQLANLRHRVWGHEGEILVDLAGFRIRHTDGRNLYVQYRDEFVRRIYHFTSSRSDPLILDGGSNVGLSVLYFKRLYPAARIVAFEPDPNIFRLLEQNIHDNHLKAVEMVPRGLAPEEGHASFHPDGKAGGQLSVDDSGLQVETTRLSHYLDQPVDFLKLNIEGFELPVLLEAEASGKLRNVQEIAIEYHGWAGQDQQLGPLLDLLDRNGFRYYVQEYEGRPAYRWDPSRTWFCLVYARRSS